MKMKNPTDHPIAAFGLGFSFAPGEVREIEDGYCRPRRAANNEIMNAIIEDIAPGIVPADEKVAATWHDGIPVAADPPPRKGQRRDGKVPDWAKE